MYTIIFKVDDEVVSYVVDAAGRDYIESVPWNEVVRLGDESIAKKFYQKTAKYVEKKDMFKNCKICGERMLASQECICTTTEEEKKKINEMKKKIMDNFKKLD